MGKVALYLIIIVGIQLALSLFVGTGETPISSGDETFTTPVTSLVLEPENWYSNLFSSFILQTLAALTGLGLIAAAFFVRNDIVLWIGIGLVFISFIPPVYILYTTLSSSSFAGAMTPFIIGIFTMPIILIFIGLVLDFIRGKD